MAGKRRPPARRSVEPTPWWGEGPAPHERWPGVTIEIEAHWSRVNARWESPDGRFYFDPARADKACDFFPTFLVHHRGEFAGQPFELLPYQRFIVRAVFGWLRAADGLRRFRKTFLAVPKGNGKSPFAAGISLYLLLCDDEPGAEVYAAAADRDQAAIVFDTAKVMVEHSEDLAAMCEVWKGSIVVPSTVSTYKVLSREVAGKHGPNIHGLCFDEFHAQKSRALFEALQRGMVKRRQPLLVMITTAGDDDESICFEEWSYARRVQTGNIEDETYLPVLFEMSAEEDWKSETVWARVNPGLGITVKVDALRSECAAAVNEPKKLNDYLRYHGNRWTNQAVAWFPIEWWDACGALPVYVPGLTVAAGLDLAQRVDLAAFDVVIRHPLELAPVVEAEVVTEEGDALVKNTLRLAFEISVFSFFWIPEETMRDRERTDRVPYAQWADAGFVTVTEGAVIDFDRILDDVTRKVIPRFGLKGARCGFDPAFASDLAPRLQKAGLQMVETLQNYKALNTPAQAFYALLKAGRVRHGCAHLSHPLRWCAENVAVKTDDAGRIRPVKPKNRNKRIDGIVAALMGLDQILREPEPRRSVYEKRGPLVFEA